MQTARLETSQCAPTPDELLVFFPIRVNVQHLIYRNRFVELAAMLQTLSSLTGSQPVASPFDASVTSRWCWHTVEPRRPNRPSASSPDTSNSFCWQSFHSLFSWGSGLPLTWQRVSGRRNLHSFAFSIYGEVLYILMFLCAMPYNPIASYGMTIVTHHRSKSFILKWTFSILMAEKTCLSNGIATQDGSWRQK